MVVVVRSTEDSGSTKQGVADRVVAAEGEGTGASEGAPFATFFTSIDSYMPEICIPKTLYDPMPL